MRWVSLGANNIFNAVRMPLLFTLYNAGCNPANKFCGYIFYTYNAIEITNPES